jgi:hypothetical protein
MSHSITNLTIHVSGKEICVQKKFFRNADYRPCHHVECEKRLWIGQMRRLVKKYLPSFNAFENYASCSSRATRCDSVLECFVIFLGTSVSGTLSGNDQKTRIVDCTDVDGNPLPGYATKKDAEIICDHMYHTWILGVVQSWNPAKGFGFIQTPATAMDHFVWWEVRFFLVCCYVIVFIGHIFTH